MPRVLFPFRYNEIHDKKVRQGGWVPVSQTTWSKQRPFLLSYMIFFSLQFDRCLLKLWVSCVWGGEQNHVGPWFCSGSVYVCVWAHTPVTLWSQRVWVSTPMILWSQCVWVSTHMTLWSQWACVSTPMMLWSQYVCVSTPMILWSQCKWVYP